MQVLDKQGKHCSVPKIELIEAEDNGTEGKTIVHLT